MHSSRMCTARGSSRLLGEGGVCLSACWDTLGCGPGNHLGVGLETPQGVGLETPPGVGLETPLGVGLVTPQARPLNFPLGVGLETPQARPLNFPHGCGPGDLQGMLGYHLQCMLGYHPPVDRMTDTCKNITFANFVCGR